MCQPGRENSAMRRFPNKNLNKYLQDVLAHCGAVVFYSTRSLSSHTTGHFYSLLNNLPLNLHRIMQVQTGLTSIPDKNSNLVFRNHISLSQEWTQGAWTLLRTPWMHYSSVLRSFPLCLVLNLEAIPSPFSKCNIRVRNWSELKWQWWKIIFLFLTVSSSKSKGAGKKKDQISQKSLESLAHSKWKMQ